MKKASKRTSSPTDDFYVFQDLSLRHGGDIDFAVIGPTGIFAIEVKATITQTRDMHSF